MGDGPLVAVLGGGQLGRMLALAGIPMGLRFRFLDPSPDVCAADVGEVIVGAFDDPGALARLTAGADLVTYEWEGVPAATVAGLLESHRVFPGPISLAASQDRVAEKQLLASLGIATAPFAAVDSSHDLHAALRQTGVPAILKTRRGGYDGRGQVRITSLDNADAARVALAGQDLILEGEVAFDRELSVLGCRSSTGEVAVWPVAHNVHRDGILRTSRAPVARLDAAVERAAHEIVEALLVSTGHIGVLCVELFQISSELIANEFAPRVHNSGHWTIDGAVTSQFENHLRAGLGWPLGSTAAHGWSAMVNCIGVMPDPHALLAVPGSTLHDYRKAARRGRKVGHVSITARHEDAREHALARVLAVIEDDG